MVTAVMTISVVEPVSAETVLPRVTPHCAANPDDKWCGKYVIESDITLESFKPYRTLQELIERNDLPEDTTWDAVIRKGTFVMRM